MAAAFSKPGVMPGIGLFLLFAGIWTGDSALIGLAQPSGGYLPIRVFSLAAYAALFIALSGGKAVRSPGRPPRPSRAHRPSQLLRLLRPSWLARSSRAQASPSAHPTRFKRWAALGCGLFALGAVGVLALRGQDAGALVLVPLAFAKCVGPLLSIPLLASFSTLPRRTATSVSTISLACAFAVEPIARTAVAATEWGPEALLAAGAVLLGAAGWACSRAAAQAVPPTTQADPRAITGDAVTRFLPIEDAIPSRRAEQGDVAAARADDPATRGRGEGRQTAPHVRRRVFRHAPSDGLLTRSSLVGIAGTVMLLGFMRTEGFPGAGIGAAPALIVLVAGLFATGRLPALEAHELFRAAVVCTAAGFLLDPVLSPVAPDAEQLLAGVGATLFEIVVWTTSAIIVGSCGNRLRAAAATRLAAVSGHLLGALVAMAATAVGDAIPQAEEAASLFLVFAYVVGLLYLSGDKTLRSVLSAQERPREDAGRRAGATSAATTDSASAGASDLASAPAPTPADSAPAHNLAPADLLYWKRPCALVAEACGLTPRETEVLEQLAQGRDLAFMEERFTISRNTIKMHTKRVYAKLGVHSKQELIDLVDSVRERERFAEGDR